MKSLILLSEESGILLFSDSYEKKNDLDYQYASLETIQLSSSLFALYKLSLSLSNGALQWLQKGDSLLLFRSSPKGKQISSSDCHNGEGLLLIVDIDIAFERKIAEDITDKMFNVFLRHNLSPAQSPRLPMQKVLRAAIAEQFCEIICDFLRHLIAVESSGIFSNLNKSTYILLCRPRDVTESIIGSRIPTGPSPDIFPDKDHECSHLPSPVIPISPSSDQSDDSLVTSRTDQFYLFRCCAFILRYCMCFGALNIIAVPPPPPSQLAHPTDPNTKNTVHPERSVLLLLNPLGEKCHRSAYYSFQKSQTDAAYDHSQKIYDERGLNANMCKRFIEASNRSFLLRDDGLYVNHSDERKGNHGYKGSHCIPLSEQEFHIIERTTVSTSNSDLKTEIKLNDNERNSCYEVKTIECYGIRILICTSNIESSIIETEMKALEGDKEKREICDSLSAWKHLCIFGAIGFSQGFIPTII